MVEVFNKWNQKEVMLTKIVIHEDKQSMVNVGDTVKGTLYITDFKDWKIPGYENLTGFCVSVVSDRIGDFIKTSPVQSIESNDDNTITFNTKTSKYRLILSENNNNEEK